MTLAGKLPLFSVLRARQRWAFTHNHYPAVCLIHPLDEEALYKALGSPVLPLNGRMYWMGMTFEIDTTVPEGELRFRA